MRLGVSSDGKRIEKTLTEHTPQSFDSALETLQSMMQELTGGEVPDAVAGGLPGVLNHERTEALQLPHLPQWDGKQLRGAFEDVFGAPVTLENDAALGGLGEAHFGAGRGKGIVMYITVSTGVGGSVITEGTIPESAYGFEPGKQIVDKDTGQTLEQLIGGTAVEQRFGTAPASISDVAVWDELARTLAAGIHNSVVHWSPDIVVLGGSMILGTPGISVDRVRDHLAELLTIFPAPPETVSASLGDESVLYGGLALLSS